MKKHKVMAWVILIVSVITMVPMLIICIEAVTAKHIDESMLGMILYSIKH
jgi:hypothetical protein